MAFKIEPWNLKLSKCSDHYFEAQKHHTYFNRKLFISKEGEIKNAPECEEIFGQINAIKSQEELLELIDLKEFQKYWHITKQQTNGCQICEFRNICVDNRLPKKEK